MRVKTVLLKTMTMLKVAKVLRFSRIVEIPSRHDGETAAEALQRVSDCDNIKSIWFSPQASICRGRSARGRRISVYRLELSILHMPSSIPGPALEPFNYCCDKT